jgi:Na+-driven multidrug efflux pump
MLVAYAQGAGAIVTVMLLLALVPPLNVTGAAIASSVAYAVTFGILVLAMARRSADKSPDTERAVVAPPGSIGADHGARRS